MSELPKTYVPGFHDEDEVRKMKYFEFGNTGMEISQLSLGTAGFSFLFGEYDFDQCKATVHEAIKRGINYIDTAPLYGYGISEDVLGKCLEDIPREAYYIATKVGRYGENEKSVADYSAKKTKESIENSLKALGLEYVDVLQVHSIDHAPSLDIILNETLPALDEIRKQGKTKFVGITGYPLYLLVDCLKKSSVKIDTVLSFARLSLLDQALKDYLPFFKSKHLGIINAAPHCVGLLSSAGPPEWHWASQEIRDVCDEANEYCKKNDAEIGKLALDYALHQEGPHTHLVGMNNTEVLRMNLDVYQNGLTDKEKAVSHHLKNNIFPNLKKTDWE